RLPEISTGPVFVPEPVTMVLVTLLSVPPPVMEPLRRSVPLLTTVLPEYVLVPVSVRFRKPFMTIPDPGDCSVIALIRKSAPAWFAAPKVADFGENVAVPPVRMADENFRVRIFPPEDR